MTVEEAATIYQLPDLHSAINEYLDRCASGMSHDITGHRHTLPDSNLLSDRLQIWTKVRVQVRNYHDPQNVEAAQTMNAFPPSREHPHGLYDSAVFSPTSASDWPSQGLDGTYCMH